MEMVVGSKEVKELEPHGAGWATHVNTEISRKDGTQASAQDGTVSSESPALCT